MHKLDQRGELLIPLIIVVVLLFASLGFGAWAFMGMQDYKNNTDQKVGVAVKLAEEKLSEKKDAEFAESYKLPNNTYRSAAHVGSLIIEYPKTWSNYVVERDGSVQLNGYMYPSYVPENDQDTNYALRYQVMETAYDTEVRKFDSKVRSGALKTSPYRLPKVQGTLGLRAEGEFDNRKQGVMIVLPLRDKTIKIWTEGSEFRSDFEKILSTLTFTE